MKMFCIVFFSLIILSKGELYGVVTETNPQYTSFSSWVVSVDIETGNLTSIAATGYFYEGYGNFFVLFSLQDWSGDISAFDYTNSIYYYATNYAVTPPLWGVDVKNKVAIPPSYLFPDAMQHWIVSISVDIPTRETYVIATNETHMLLAALSYPQENITAVALPISLSSVSSTFYSQGVLLLAIPPKTLNETTTLLAYNTLSKEIISKTEICDTSFYPFNIFYDVKAQKLIASGFGETKTQFNYTVGIVDMSTGDCEIKNLLDLQLSFDLIFGASYDESTSTLWFSGSGANGNFIQSANVYTAELGARIQTPTLLESLQFVPSDK